MTFKALVSGLEKWQRGKARIEGDSIILDRAGWKEYELHTATDVHYDIAWLAKPFPSRVSDRDALVFAEKYGLLLTRPPITGPWKEDLRAWNAAAGTLETVIARYNAYQAVLMDDRRGMDALREWYYLTGGREPNPDEKLMQTVPGIIAQTLSDGISGCTLTIREGRSFAMHGLGNGLLHPGVLGYVAVPRSLLNHAYIQLAALMTNNVTFSTCAECQKVFTPTRRNKMYCSESCKNKRKKRAQRGKQVLAP